MRAASPLDGMSSLDFAEDHLKQLTSELKEYPAFAIFDALMVLFEDFYYSENLSEPAESSLAARDGSPEHIRLREHIRLQLAYFHDLPNTIYS